MKIGFAKTDITPRIGVELQGYGPFLCRKSTGIRDRLFARAMAAELDGTELLLISCDLTGLNRDYTGMVREKLSASSGIPVENIMVHSIHTHSGPATAGYKGWGVRDLPYMELLPFKIIEAGRQALANRETASLMHAEVPCEGVATNRVYDKFSWPLEEIRKDDWRPDKPELTDTVCHVVKAENADGRLLGFFSYFGCHPVVCGSDTHQISGDYAGIATNLVEEDHPGSVGLFLLGAQGDVNAAVVAHDEFTAMPALDVLANRYAAAVRLGLDRAESLVVDELRAVSDQAAFTRKDLTREDLAGRLAQAEARLHSADASDADRETRMAMVEALALWGILEIMDTGGELSPLIEIQGFRFGPLALLACPFEVMQQIKNDVRAAAKAPIPLVMSMTNDTVGYATDRASAAKGGYEADIAPMILGAMPYAATHDELTAALLKVDKQL